MYFLIEGSWKWKKWRKHQWLTQKKAIFERNFGRINMVKFVVPSAASMLPSMASAMTFKNANWILYTNQESGGIICTCFRWLYHPNPAPIQNNKFRKHARPTPITFKIQVSEECGCSRIYLVQQECICCIFTCSEQENQISDQSTYEYFINPYRTSKQKGTWKCW